MRYHILSFYFCKEIPGGYDIYNAFDIANKEMGITGQKIVGLYILRTPEELIS